MKIREYFFLVLILALGFYLRTYNIDWDSGFHLHPDERAIVLATTPLHIPQNLHGFFSVDSPLNTHFFAYGSFPMYLLKIVSIIPGHFDPLFMAYDKINLVGRFLSAFFDSLTIFLVFLIGKKLFNKKVGLFAGFVYAISVLPIQLSHFYAVDTTLTFFMTATLYRLILFYEKPTIKNTLLVGIFFGLALATKTSAIALILSIGIAICIDFVLLFIKQPHKPHVWLPHLPKFIKELLLKLVLILISAGIVFLICEPYAAIDFKDFLDQNLQQATMTKSAYVFPYTLQYVGKIPYVYELKNVFLWGEGPLLAIFSFLGIFFITKISLFKDKKIKWAQELILMIFFWSYLIVVGKFAVGWIRYMLPVYPLFALSAAVFVYKLFGLIKNKLIHATFYILLTTALLIWPVAFMHIYDAPNTRVQATDWILNAIPAGKTLSIEHWDDSLPMTGQDRYTMQTLELYNPDDEEKWQKINSQIAATDYIIIASNRLYVPLQKLIDCKHLEPDRCYPLTSLYYKELFGGKLGFTKVAEFAEYPTIPFLNIRIDDQSADESFTVYDHPKVMVFQKN